MRIFESGASLGTAEVPSIPDESKKDLPKEKIYLFDHSPHLRDEWDYEKNVVDPETLTYGSGKKVWWVCKIGHKWEISPNKRTAQVRGCPFCTNRQILLGYNDLSTTHPKISQELVDTSIGGTVSAGSHKKVDWKCLKGHKWLAVVKSRALYDHGCPECASINKISRIKQRALPTTGKTDLWTTHPELAIELIDASIGYRVSAGSDSAKVGWRCERGHEWNAVVYSRTGLKSGCPKCFKGTSSKSESRLREHLRILFPSISEDHTSRIPIPFSRFKTMSIDMKWSIGVWKIICEYDGSYFHRNRLGKDTEKTQLLLNAGYLVIRVREKCPRNVLVDLPVDDPNLLQLSVPYSTKDDHLIEAVEKIKQWLHERTTNEQDNPSL